MPIKTITLRVQAVVSSYATDEGYPPLSLLAPDNQSHYLVEVMAIANFFRQITVEPVAFLYVLAIFAEYTSLQELVFTSICLNIGNETDPTLCNKHGHLPDELQDQITVVVSDKMKY